MLSLIRQLGMFKMRESRFQKNLIDELHGTFPGCVIIKNDAGYLQGILDLTILFGHHWAMLEVKKSLAAPYQPNQEYYIEMFNSMSYAAMICPENKEDIINELKCAFS